MLTSRRRHTRQEGSMDVSLSATELLTMMAAVAAAITTLLHTSRSRPVQLQMRDQLEELGSRVGDLRMQINSRLAELLNLARQAGYAEGFRPGRVSEACPRAVEMTCPPPAPGG